MLRGRTWRRGRGARYLVGVLLLLVAACGSEADTTIDVFAAASLANAFEDVVDAYELEHRDVQVRVNLAGSSALREQLRDGADADVFVSANQEIMAELVADGTVAGQPVVVATNTMVLAVPAGNPGQVSGLRDLEDSSLFVGVCAAGVPCGDLATTMLDAAGVVAAIDTAESDAAALVRRLLDAELDAALVYASDVASSNGALQGIVDGDAAPAASYPIAAVNDSAEAARFVEFVRSDRGAAILRRWGFETP